MTVKIQLYVVNHNLVLFIHKFIFGLDLGLDCTLPFPAVVCRQRPRRRYVKMVNKSCGWYQLLSHRYRIGCRNEKMSPNNNTVPYLRLSPSTHYPVTQCQYHSNPKYDFLMFYSGEQCLPDTGDASVTPPSEDDSSHAKKSLFEALHPTAETTSDQYSEQVKESVANDGDIEENGRHLSNYNNKISYVLLNTVSVQSFCRRP